METPNIYQQYLNLKNTHNRSKEQEQKLKELEKVINSKEVIY